MAIDYVAVVSWLALYLGLGVAALPLLSAVCSRLPDRGAGLALPGALALLAVVGYWVGQWRFGPLTGAIAIAVLLLASAAAIARGVRVDWERYVGVALVFSLAFLLLLQVRALNPGAVPGGGEKFLDFGLLASLLRADALPPQDVWFAGETVQYYYGGHMLAALLAELTGTSAEYAYNYALAGYYAAYVATAYGLAGSIAAGAGRSYEVAGALAAVFVGIASNLAPPIRLLSWALPGERGRRLLEAASLGRDGLALGPRSFDYWPASRVVDSGGGQLITEFPFFAFLNGDLHGHMMSPPFLLLIAGLGYAYYRTPTSAPWRQRALPLVAAAPLVGLLALVNTWSVPAAIGLIGLAVYFAPASPRALLGRRPAVPAADLDRGRRLAREVERLVGAVAVALVGAAVGGITVLPFLLGPASGRELGFLPTPRSDLPGLLVVHGAFLGISVAYLLARSPRARRWLGRPALLAGLGLLFAVSWLFQATAVALFLPPLVAAWLALRWERSGGSPSAGDRPGGSATSDSLGGAATSDEPGGATGRGLGYESVLFVGVLGLLLIVEFAYVVEDAGPGRFNTFFKTYTQVWALWAVVAGIALPAVADARAALGGVERVVGRLARRLRGRDVAPRLARSRDGGGGRDGARSSRYRRVGAVLAAVVLVSTSLYAGFGLAWQFETGRDEMSLDARAFVAHDDFDGHPEEYEAIEWLDDLEGQPTLVEAPGLSIYQWVNGPSSLTGIPTVAGWIHETGYREPAAYNARVEDVNALYTGSPARRGELLREYDVQYVYVGPVERDRYDGADLEFGDEPGITVAHQSGSVTIYGVDQSALSATSE